MKMAEIERALKDADPKIRYYILRLQEQVLAQQEQIDTCAALLLQLVSQVGFIVETTAEQKELIGTLSGKNKNEGLVESVLPEPED